MLKSCVTLFIIIFLIGCNTSQNTNSDVIGQWGLSDLVVSDSIWQVETEPVTLIIDDKGAFQLNWYGGVTQNGEYNLSKSRLIIEDKENKARYLDILRSTPDSLILNGILNDQEVKMSFRRLD